MALETSDQILRGEDALSLLLEILCGLHSPIVGETEVFGQFKNFVESRRQENDPLFEDHQKWLQFVFSEVKRLRSEHLVGLGSQSYGSLLRRYTKDHDSATLCGSGQLAMEILPWLTTKEHVQVLCRQPAAILPLAKKHENLSIDSYDSAYIHGEALIIAAAISDESLVTLLQRQDTRPRKVFDLRGEENDLAQILTREFPHIQYMSLQEFFAEIEENKKETARKIAGIKAIILEKSQLFAQRMELRPLGWDDLWS